MVGQRVVPLRHRSLQPWLLVGVPRGLRGLVACRGSRFSSGPVLAGPDPGGCGEFEAPGQCVGAGQYAIAGGPGAPAKVFRYLYGVDVSALTEDVRAYFDGSREKPALIRLVWPETSADL